MALTRVFDLIRHQLATFPRPDCLNARDGQTWHSYSTREVVDTADRLSHGLLALGIRRGDKVALVANNCPEWLLVDLALQQIGAVSVPLYPTLPVDDMRYIVDHAGIKLAFAGDKALFQRVIEATDHLPSCPVYTFTDVPGAPSWHELLLLGGDGLPAVLDALRDSIQAEDLLTIIYTSGTTGRPKGVMLSHHNVVSNALAVARFTPLAHGAWKAVSFLPLSHVFERSVTYIYFYAGIGVYYAKSVEAIAATLNDVHPELFTTVPRLLEKVYEKLVGKQHELTGFTRKLYQAAIRHAETFEPRDTPGMAARLRHRLFDRLVYSKWRAALGGNTKMIVVGSAALQPRLSRLFWAAGIIVSEGYGMTEASPILTGNIFSADRTAIGTVGVPMDNVEIRLAPDGEILARGPNVMLGYYRDPEQTAEALRDGWLHTGDVGEFDPEGNLRITDRKKEMFKTSCGKYVAPQVIENKLKESAFIDQVMVVGDGRKYASALVVPLFEQLRTWCAQQGLNLKSESEMVAHPRVRELIEHEVKRFNRLFGNWEQVKKIALVDRPWSIDAGELAPTLKLRRKVICERFHTLIDSMYTGPACEHGR